MSFRRFCGWEPAVETVYHYDEAGRVTHTTTEREPEWDEQERAWFLALARVEAEDLCPLCGRPRAVCQAAENEDRFTVDPPTRCHATTAVVTAQDAYKDQLAARALLFHAHLRA